MSFEKLKIYQIAIELSKEIDEWSRNQSFYWKDKEIIQIQRSSSSVPSNIIEGYSYKIYPKKYIFFLTIALGSSDETQIHSKILNNREQMDEKTYEYFTHKYKDLSIRILNLAKFISKENNLS